MALSKANQFTKLFVPGSLKTPQLLLKTTRSPLKLCLRLGGGAPRMLRTRTLSNGMENIRMILRYWLYGVIPASLLVAYTKLFIGDAVLHDYDPDVYEPEEYEYHKYPIQRWLSKWIVEDPRVTYYKYIQKLEVQMGFSRQARFTAQVFQLQALERTGMIAFFSTPLVDRDTRDRLDTWAKEHGYEEKPYSDR